MSVIQKALSKPVPNPLHVLAESMILLLQVWNGTENAHDVLEDACHTIAHEHGLTPRQTYELWKTIEADSAALTAIKEQKA